jgi:hypothetical protein
MDLTRYLEKLEGILTPEHLEKIKNYKGPLIKYLHSLKPLYSNSQIFLDMIEYVEIAIALDNPEASNDSRSMLVAACLHKGKVFGCMVDFHNYIYLLLGHPTFTTEFMSATNDVTLRRLTNKYPFKKSSTVEDIKVLMQYPMWMKTSPTGKWTSIDQTMATKLIEKK